MPGDNYPRVWTELFTNNDLQVLRLIVPGGWLVAVRDKSVTNAPADIFFIHDPENNWELNP